MIENNTSQLRTQTETDIERQIRALRSRELRPSGLSALQELKRKNVAVAERDCLLLERGNNIELAKRLLELLQKFESFLLSQVPDGKDSEDVNLNLEELNWSDTVMLIIFYSRLLWSYTRDPNIEAIYFALGSIEKNYMDNYNVYFGLTNLSPSHSKNVADYLGFIKVVENFIASE